VAVIRENVQALGAGARARVEQRSVLAALALHPADIVFLDPPYSLESEYAAALALAHVPLVIVQHSARFDPGEAHGDLRRTRLVKQGDNALSFYALDMQL
jgi:16S rRNA G966 N2-methylase RsmD